MSDRTLVRPFGPSNQPDTCLYCGVALKYTVWKAYDYTQTVTLCCQAPTTSVMEREPGIAGWRNVWRCSRCRRELVLDGDDTETVARTSPEKRSHQKGYDGLFCTRSCGYDFGRLAAKKGVRYQQRP